MLSDPRHRKNRQHALSALLGQGVYGRLAGYENVNDAEVVGQFDFSLSSRAKMSSISQSRSVTLASIAGVTRRL